MSRFNKFKKSTSVISISLLVSIITSSAFAEESAKTEEIPTWKSNVEFGYVSTSGNSETTSINGAFAATYEIDSWKHAVSLKSLFSSATDADTNEDKTSAERYTFQGKSDYKFSDDGYAFGVLDYDTDRFSDNDYLTSLTFGRGFKFTPSEVSKLDLEIGLGYRQTKKRETIDFPSEKINETVVRLAANYSWDITEHSKFEQNLSIESGEENTVTKSYTGLSSNVAENLALKLSLTATHQSDVRVGSEELDTVTAVTIVFNF